MNVNRGNNDKCLERLQEHQAAVFTLNSVSVS